jgi:membrane-associated HD superfamily phosphohydrolase
MANLITIDPTESGDEEFTPDELESLEVGEQLAQENQELLAGKYRDAAELEQAYLELQKKLGQRDEEPEQVAEEEETEEEEIELPAGAQLIQEASNEYYQNGGQLSEETLEQFSQMSSRDLVEAYLALQDNQPQQEVAQVTDLSEREVNFIQNSVGGEAAYSNLVQWAAENLPADYVNAFDSVVESGQVQAIQLAVAGLQREYENAVGYEGRILSGKAATQTVDVFRSQAEVVRAMQDPRYDNDPAYRQDVFEKMERSNIQY